jgi:acetylornithine deacetylase/succinyl-diaminopimelate desuccinylase-like protein
MMRACLLLLLASPIWSQPSIDWSQQKTEILKLYRDLIRIDTRAGNETKAVEYIRQVLDKDGIPSKTFALDPARANIVAPIKGKGSKRPLLILAHTDVVGVQPEKWPVDPFSAAIKDGYVWGRGSLDDKPVLTATLMTMLLLKRNQVPLDRDVIFMAESGEEADTTGVGINFMTERHYDEIDAEYSLTEGGGATSEDGKVVTMNIGTAEKLPARVRLIATGTSGHGSVPRIDNALIHLGAAVEKVGQWQTPMRLNDTTHTYFEKLATVSTPEKAARYNALLNPATADAAQAYLREHEPGMYSMLRTSVVPTRLKAGVGDNVIPSEAEATLDIRALPDENIPNFYAQMAKIINDPQIKIVPLPATRPPSPASRLDTEVDRVLEQVSKRMYPSVTVFPSMSTGSSDKAQLRNKGQQSYGIGPAGTRADTTDFGAAQRCGTYGRILHLSLR